MTLSAIVSTVKTNFVNAIEAVDKPAVKGGGDVGQSFTAGTTSAGAYMAQGSGTGAPGSGSLVKKLLVGGVLGAGAGFGASFLPIAWITNLGPGGWAAKGIMAAAGAAVGVVGALAVHFIGKKKALAMEAQQAATQQPTTVTPAPVGETLRMGSKGDEVLALQKNLKAMGQFYPKVTGTFDKTTQNAIRRYEVMKGVQPTGLGSPDVVQAIAQDSGLIKQLA